ncbi:MAG: AIPR family protein [Candidatus Pacebacteria bacterium]|nr:AIPR family protein [Candidatus Paceibacterota bacterium]
MSNNDQIILDQILSEEHAKRASGLKESEFFELFVAEQALKSFDLSDDEIEFGIAGSSLDGGLDGIYTFANGELVQDDFDSSGLKKNVLIEVVLIQSKTSNGFNEDAMNKFAVATSDLFSLAHSLDDFKQRYNEGVRASAELFRALYRKVAGRFPELEFRYIYASRGDSRTVHPNVAGKSEYIKKAVLDLFDTAKFDFAFYGASELLALARRRPTTTFNMQFTESLTGDKGYVALVTLSSFSSLIRGEDGELRKELFEANVRDYQGRTQVNEEMQQTLVGRGPEDFWWLNNGITIVVSKATQNGKSLTMEDPQIVNGQQTSTEIFNFYKDENPQNEKRSVMVRVIIADDPTGRDRIIKATNSQTAIPPASLRATENIQRQIEEYLRPFGIYYDRRKNSQRQQGRSADSIISISLLAQALMAIVLQRPNDARARPSSLIKKEDDYKRLFTEKIHIEIYLYAAKLIKLTRAFLRSIPELAPKDRNNIIFYVAMYASAIATNKAAPNADELASVAMTEIDANVIAKSFAEVMPIYQMLGASDLVAKGTEFVAQLKVKLCTEFPSSGWPRCREL